MKPGGELRRTGPPERRTPLVSRTELARGGPLERRTRLRPVSDRRRAEADARRLATAQAERQDGGCVLHIQLGVAYRFPGPALCHSRPGRAGLEHHEVLTRGRGGSALDADNIATLCPEAHDWVTEHAEAAEALGLILPGWAGPERADEAWRIRRRRMLVAYPIEPPSWREGDRAWHRIVRRDLAGWPEGVA